VPTIDFQLLRYNPLLSPKHQIGPVGAFAVWAGITLIGVGYALSVRFGRVDSAATLATFSIYLAAAVFFANAMFSSSFAPGSGRPLAIFLARVPFSRI
jgi:hypothetical protein